TKCLFCYIVIGQYSGRGKIMRRHYSLHFKHEVIRKALEIKDYSLVARKYRISSLTIYRWLREYKEGKYKAQ
ncbi:helix-turn-helix domain-containing protein, partial [Aneurinibacillus aneurinilyticus]|uniref:helix-turn-helix domain-containing protein n=1 Tax=Aneurinibacillus aneurinilyticus TaxID=1391 RepID=UPI002E1AF391|nr:helix-turn-helix domain-containing protein [Aneurinibacillus aneurinilyticus]MED0743459.1 helix-turn-helix domain-containing protein [Aneurinibacillus aneurinilyticus]